MKNYQYTFEHWLKKFGDRINDIEQQYTFFLLRNIVKEHAMYFMVTFKNIVKMY